LRSRGFPASVIRARVTSIARPPARMWLMEMKKLSNLVIDFLGNDIVWLVFYVAFAATVVERSITWLFFSELAGGMTLRVVVDLLSTGVILGTLFSVWLWLAIAENTFRTVMGKLTIAC
jgi:hypothetical protein